MKNIVKTLLIIVALLSASKLSGQWRLVIENTTTTCSTMTASFFDVNNNPTGNLPSYALPVGLTPATCQCTGITPSYAIITEGSCSVRINVAFGNTDCSTAGGTCGCGCLTPGRQFEITSVLGPASACTSTPPCSSTPGTTMDIKLTIK